MVLVFLLGNFPWLYVVLLLESCEGKIEKLDMNHMPNRLRIMLDL